jgi:hypothetical protein
MSYYVTVSYCRAADATAGRTGRNPTGVIGTGGPHAVVSGPAVGAAALAWG